MSFSKKNDPFDIVEHRVRENNDEFFDDLRIDEEEDTIERIREREPEYSPKGKEKKYNWAFFLASMFVGLGITAATGLPLPLFLGMGVGFLFFVDPIYEKVIRIIEGRR